MEIESVSPSISSQDVSCESKIDKFEKLWNEWFDDPTKQNGERLLHFLERNKNYFENLAKGKPVPHGWPAGTTFSHYYEAAIHNLQGWITHGCDPKGTTPVSEWISDVNVWIHEK